MSFARKKCFFPCKTKEIFLSLSYFCGSISRGLNFDLGHFFHSLSSLCEGGGRREGGGSKGWGWKEGTHNCTLHSMLKKCPQHSPLPRDIFCRAEYFIIKEKTGKSVLYFCWHFNLCLTGIWGRTARVVILPPGLVTMLLVSYSQW